MISSHLFSFNFDDGRDRHGDAGEYEANSYTLQIGDSGGDTGDFAKKRHGNVVIDRDDDDKEHDWDDWKRCWRDFERFCDTGVHCEALLDGEGL